MIHTCSKTNENLYKIFPWSLDLEELEVVYVAGLFHMYNVVMMCRGERYFCCYGKMLYEVLFYLQGYFKRAWSRDLLELFLYDHVQIISGKFPEDRLAYCCMTTPCAVARLAP